MLEISAVCLAAQLHRFLPANSGRVLFVVLIHWEQIPLSSPEESERSGSIDFLLFPSKRHRVCAQTRCPLGAYFMVIISKIFPFEK